MSRIKVQDIYNGVTISILDIEETTNIYITDTETEQNTVTVIDTSYDVARVTAAVGEANTIKEDTQGLYEDTVIAKDAAVDAKKDAVIAKGAAETAEDGAEAAQLAAEAARDLATTTVNNSLTSITSHTEDKKVELDTYTTTKEGVLDAYTTTKEGELDTYTTAKEGEIDTHTTTKKGELDSYVLLTSKPDLDTYVLSTLKPDLDTYRTATIQPAIAAYVDATTKPSIDAYTSTQAATVVQPLVDKAEQWAEETEDIEVETGKYSAKHYAAKAADEAAVLASSIGTLDDIDELIKDKIYFGCYTIAEIDAMIADGYVPVSTPADFYAIRSTASRTFGSGTPWEGTYSGGLSTGKKYIQVKDIDMYYDTQDPNGAYYNGGDGLGYMGNTASSFIYDGGGKVLKNCKINRGLFNYMLGTVRNWGIEDVILTMTNETYGGIFGSLNFGNYPTLVERCFITGIAFFGTVGEYKAVWFGNSGGMINGFIKNCMTAVQIGSDTDRMGTYTGWNGMNLLNCFSIGTIHSTGGSSIYELSYNSVKIRNSYINSDTSEKSSSNGLTTVELYNLDEFNLDGNTWEFTKYRYPILKVFGERSWNRIQPLTLTSYLEDGNIILNWTSVYTRPKEFLVYKSEFNGSYWSMWELLGITENLYYSVSTYPEDISHIKFFVKGAY